ncbi:MAG: RluA family pseudouridine synthase [Erysipelotrichaceae bacterium]
MKEENWIISEEEVGLRLDKLLTQRASELSRNRIQQLIENGDVLIDEKIRKSNYKVKLNERLFLRIPEDEELGAEPEDMDLDVCYEDHDIIVINKAKGIVVHPSIGTPNHTLVNALLFHCKDLSGINGVLRPGIVHRIDKDTSGLLVVAKNDVAHQALAAQLVDKTMHRNYVALVHGVMEHDYGTIDAPIGRDEKDRQRMCITSKNSKPAITHFKVRERFDEYTLVECRLETGRTHQIRVHMQYIKHPIVGDPKYSYRKTMDCEGQLLHAYELTLVHPRTKETMSFHAPIPQEFEDILVELRRNKR